MFETGVILLELSGFLAGFATGVLELKDNGLERGDWVGRLMSEEMEGERRMGKLTCLLEGGDVIGSPK